MTANSSRVAASQPTDIEPLISVMVVAFAADPVARWMYRDPERYLAYFGRFIRAFAGKAFSTGTAWRIDGNLGGALWLPPGVKPDEDAIAAILDASVPPEVMADVNAMFGEMAAYHPRDPHWYLPTIGIEPHLRGKGQGPALLTEALSRCDQEHMPATFSGRRLSGRGFSKG
jgi:ribosomal protein S18 acetylase RimI-like enzyme